MSYIDPAVVGATCDKVPLTFIAKQELFDHPRFGWWFKAVGCIPAERESGSFRPLKVAIEKLKSGRVSLAIFPEGTRSADASLQKAEPGIGLIAVKVKAPIIPIYVSGTDKVLPKGAKKARPYKVVARVGKAVDISESKKFSDKRKVYEDIGGRVMEAIAGLKNV